MRAINDMNLPKWVAQDVPLYMALLGDVFPGLELPVPFYESLDKAVREYLDQNGLQHHENSILKVVQTSRRVLALAVNRKICFAESDTNKFRDNCR